MGNLERAAVLARSRGAKKPKLGEKPSWWISEEDMDRRRKNFSSSLEVEAQLISGQGVSYSVAKIISYSWDKNIGKDFQFQKNFDEKMIEKLNEKAFNIYDELDNGKRYQELSELELEILIHGTKMGIFNEYQENKINTVMSFIPQSRKIKTDVMSGKSHMSYDFIQSELCEKDSEPFGNAMKEDEFGNIDLDNKK